ncbi:MAG: hypothetical protein LIP77_04465 [Planctomycetes bacterium]|nr:hypothetical protein [Planctomycetota bacterium]
MPSTMGRRDAVIGAFALACAFQRFRGPLSWLLTIPLSLGAILTRLTGLWSDAVGCHLIAVSLGVATDPSPTGHSRLIAADFLPRTSYW